MNFGTLIVLAVLILIVALILRKMYRDVKAGRSPLCDNANCSHCGGNCGHCHSGCHSADGSK
jgi:hypothetical protein